MAYDQWGSSTFEGVVVVRGEMNQQTLLSRARLFKRDTNGSVHAVETPVDRSDPDGARFLAGIAVWAHWAAAVLFLFEVAHHIVDETAKFSVYLAILTALMAFNGLLHHRLRTNRTISWGWLHALYGIDICLVSYWVATSGGLDHPFIYVFYYPVLAALAVSLAPFWRAMALVTVVAAVYGGIAVFAGDGVDIAASDHETLLARIIVLYVVVATINMAAIYTRMRRRQAEENERAVERESARLSLALQRERIELSHTIHDTAAQTAYMIGLGIDTARTLVEDGNPKLAATLEEISWLSRSSLWDLRHPINMGGIYEGKELGSTLRSHCASFTNVSGVPAEVTQAGAEPQLSAETKSRLFSIAHNALTNAFRHAKASRVDVELEFDGEGIRLSVSDDGAGLLDDHMERGTGFASMTSAAESLGGRLIVEGSGPMGGTRVTCLVPKERNGEEHRHGT